MNDFPFLGVGGQEKYTAAVRDTMCLRPPCRHRHHRRLPDGAVLVLDSENEDTPRRKLLTLPEFEELEPEDEN
jgi:hypothetical protein